ncbi:hypothetical protein BJ322DRAFT_1018376 [Thelephora terrestris]|uniref:Uncharacterized protein n=1 Tax=Thelephora terrestris TaxID=56493 RepID=A0A9P6LAX5_9AGAM|nr:hypothetical protein BJ322DRAFT_1018376 [Thelephora terrestris]
MSSINDFLRHAERRRVFNVNGLRLPAAESINRSPDDIFDLIKLAEGGFNRPFLITMRGGFQMVARVPHPAAISKYFAVASEGVKGLLWPYSVPLGCLYLRRKCRVALVRGAAKERAHLEQFGRPLLPLQRARREGYKYQEQPPSNHIENQDRYLIIA